MNNENNNITNEEVLSEELEQDLIEEKPHTIEQVIDSSLEESIIKETLFSGTLGHVNFDSGGGDNNTSGAMISEEKRKLFKREIYVGVRDTEQNLEFLGRVVEGPFHIPHEISSDSAITRTTVLHPERTKFRPMYFVSGTIEILGQLISPNKVVPTPTRPRP